MVRAAFERGVQPHEHPRHEEGHPDHGRDSVRARRPAGGIAGPGSLVFRADGLYPVSPNGASSVVPVHPATLPGPDPPSSPHSLRSPPGAFVLVPGSPGIGERPRPPTR